jgi:DNA polymerase-3 subunit beta
MKFTADSNDLLDTLKTAGRARPTSATMPILERVLLHRDGAGLTARCTNFEQHVRATCQADFDDAHNGPDEAALPYDRLTDTLQALPDTPVQITVGEGYEVRMDTDQGTYEMRASDGGHFPDLPDADLDTEIDVNGELTGAIDRTDFAVSPDSLRPAMMGLLLQPVGEDSVAVATDGHRMSKLDLDLDLAGPDLIIPDDALSMIARMDADLLQVGEDHVAVQGARGTVVSRLIEETYPSYNTVIPDNDDEMVVGREELLGAVKRASIYASSMTNQIRLQIEAGSVLVEGEDVERASESEETIPCEYDGGTLEIGFNAEYLEEILSVATSERVRFELGSPNDAAVVRPQGREDHMMLLMPVMLNDYA